MCDNRSFIDDLWAAVTFNGDGKEWELDTQTCQWLFCMHKITDFLEFFCSFSQQVRWRMISDFEVKKKSDRQEGWWPFLDLDPKWERRDFQPVALFSLDTQKRAGWGGKKGADWVKDRQQSSLLVKICQRPILSLYFAFKCKLERAFLK